MDTPVLRGIVQRLRLVAFGFDNYWDARDFADEHHGIILARHENPAMYRYLCDCRSDLADFPHLVVVIDEGVA